MGEVKGKLTVFFEEPFWIGVFEIYEDGKKNPKRLKREARKQMQKIGIGTRTQQALKLQQEQNKQQRKVKSREQKLAEAERKFELKQQKKKEKHRGH